MKLDNISLELSVCVFCFLKSDVISEDSPDELLSLVVRLFWLVECLKPTEHILSQEEREESFESFVKQDGLLESRRKLTLCVLEQA